MLDGGSGGTVSATGLFTAGAKGSTTDTVVATDSLGATARAVITIGAALAISPTSFALTVKDGATSGPDRVAFPASGGSGVYTWAVVRENAARRPRA